MKKRHLSLRWILVVTVAVLLVCTAAHTSFAARIATPDHTVAEQPQTWPTIIKLKSFDSPACLLEKRLFDDAADGKFDDFSVLQAVFIAGGIDDNVELAYYQEKVATLVEKTRKIVANTTNPYDQAAAVLQFLHEQVFSNGYDIAYTDLRRVLDDGRYNCLSATVLFNHLASEIGLDVRAIEMPGHAMSRLILAGKHFDVETTCSRWFQLKTDEERTSAITTNANAAAVVDRSKAREVSAKEVVAMIYYNRGVDLLNEKRFEEAACANAKALRLDPENSVARLNFLATLNNWSIELSNTGRFAEAVELLRYGLAMDKSFSAFSQNYVHIHRLWADRLCREHRFEEALEIVTRAKTEMPDREGLNRVESEVRQRWAKSDANNKLPKANAAPSD